MKVLLFHQLARSHGGGAVTALHRLYAGLKRSGISVAWACSKPGMESPDLRLLPRSDFLEDWIGRVTWRLGLNDIHCVSSFKIRKWGPFLEADVINIHGWHTNFFNYLALPGMAATRPIIGTMHDMWNLTGHCSQSYDCDRWRTGCGKCPYPQTFPPIGRDGTAWDWKLKNRTYRRAPNVTFVAPSAWLLDLSKQSMLGRHDLRQIPNPVDHQVYRPLDKKDARRQLGLPEDRHIIMFISVAATARAKGGDLLVRALDGLPPSLKARSLLLIMGERGEEFAEACGIQARALGYIHEDEPKATIYSAADVLVQPSRAENQSLVILESMACGTPVVAFDVGGNREITTAGPGGIIVEPENVAEMSAAIERVLLDPSTHQTLSEGGRQSVLDHYTLDLHVQRYIELYREKIEAHGASSLRSSV